MTTRVQVKERLAATDEAERERIRSLDQNICLFCKKPIPVGTEVLILIDYAKVHLNCYQDMVERVRQFREEHPKEWERILRIKDSA